MQKFGNWKLEYQSESYLTDIVHLFWIESIDGIKMFSLAYNQDKDKFGYLLYGSNDFDLDIINDRVDVIDKVCSDKYDWMNIMLLGTNCKGSIKSNNRYLDYLDFMNEIEYDELMRIIKREFVDSTL